MNSTCDVSSIRFWNYIISVLLKIHHQIYFNMFALSKRMLDQLLFARRICTTAQMKQQPSLIKLKKNQAKFQVDDGKPVFLKGGFIDKVCYSSTCIGCLIGLAMVFQLLYELAKPPSWRKPAEPDCE